MLVVAVSVREWPIVIELPPGTIRSLKDLNVVSLMAFICAEFAVEYLRPFVERIVSTFETSLASVPVPLKRRTGTAVVVAAVAVGSVVVDPAVVDPVVVDPVVVDPAVVDPVVVDPGNGTGAALAGVPIAAPGVLHTVQATGIRAASPKIATRFSFSAEIENETTDPS